MTIDDLLEAVASSRPQDWHLIHYGDLAGGPSNLEDGRGGAHTHRAVHRDDVSLGLAFGLSYIDKKRSFDFLSRFADQSAWPTLLDFLWDGSLVHRELGIVVDGGRMTLPWPEPPAANVGGLPDSELIGEKVTRREVAYWRLVHALKGSREDFDEYLERSGLVVL